MQRNVKLAVVVIVTGLLTNYLTEVKVDTQNTSELSTWQGRANLTGAYDAVSLVSASAVVVHHPMALPRKTAKQHLSVGMVVNRYSTRILNYSMCPTVMRGNDLFEQEHFSDYCLSTERPPATSDREIKDVMDAARKDALNSTLWAMSGLASADGDHPGCHNDHQGYLEYSTCGVHFMEDEFAARLGGRVVRWENSSVRVTHDIAAHSAPDTHEEKEPRNVVGCSRYIVVKDKSSKLKEELNTRAYLLPLGGWCCFSLSMAREDEIDHSQVSPFPKATYSPKPEDWGSPFPVPCRVLSPHSLRSAGVARSLIEHIDANAHSNTYESWLSVLYVYLIARGATAIAETTLFGFANLLTGVGLTPQGDLHPRGVHHNDHECCGLDVVQQLPLLPERNQMMGEYDLNSNTVFHPFSHYGAFPACAGGVNERKKFVNIKYNGQNISHRFYTDHSTSPTVTSWDALAVKYNVSTVPSDQHEFGIGLSTHFTKGGEDNPYILYHNQQGMRFNSIQFPVLTDRAALRSDCLCRHSWNMYHSKCRKRFKRCSIFSTNHPVSVRGDVNTLVHLGRPITVFLPRAFALLIHFFDNDEDKRATIAQRAIQDINTLILFYNYTFYSKLHRVNKFRGDNKYLEEEQSQCNYQRLFEAFRGSPARGAPRGTSTNFPRLLLDLAEREGGDKYRAWMKRWLQDIIAAKAPVPPLFRRSPIKGAVVTLLDESARDIMKNIWYWNLYRFAKQKNYPLLLFYIEGTLTIDDQRTLRQRVHGMNVQFHPVQYGIPVQFWKDHLVWTKNATKGYGYLYCSQFLGYEMFKLPIFDGIEYFYRIDEDTHLKSNQQIIQDPFDFMSEKGYKFMTPQVGVFSLEVDNSLSDMSWFYLESRAVTSTDIWAHAQAYFTKHKKIVWDRFIYAGCSELAISELYRNTEYYDYLWNIDFMYGIYYRQWLEQAFKTTWALINLTKSQWAYYCDLNILHKQVAVGIDCNNTAWLRRPIGKLLSKQ